ncbi:unnamed protein product, partial [Adineta ricciae]
IRDFLEDLADVRCIDRSDVNLCIQLKQLLLIQIEKYFIGKEEQWKILQNYAYFDPIGYGCLNRRERRAIESNIVASYEQRIFQEADEDIFEQTGSTFDSQQKVEQSSTSSMATFLRSIGKKKSSSSSNVRSTTKSKLNEELVAYRSLAQKEFNAVVEDDKNYDVMEFWEQNRSELNGLFKIACGHLVTPATSVASESAFSTASYLLRKQRSRLTPDNLCHSMFLKDKLHDDGNESDIE